MKNKTLDSEQWYDHGRQYDILVIKYFIKLSFKNTYEHYVIIGNWIKKVGTVVLKIFSTLIINLQKY